MDIGSLVCDRPDLSRFKVHRSTMMSPPIHELERQRIFDRCWLYLGHESEVPNPGDYARRVVAEHPLFFVRTREGELAVFHNTCPHRGALVCRTDRGNARAFRCFYHAWTFDTSGALVGVPDIDGYGPDFDRGEMGLRSPRFDSYRGFVFVCFDRGTEPLREYLAGAAEYLDLVADQDPGGMRVIPGSNRYSIKANWKLLAENSVDAYHTPFTHRSFFDYLADAAGGDLPAVGDRRGFGRSLGNGHGVAEIDAAFGRPIAMWHPCYGEEARAEIQSVKDELITRHGLDKALRMCEKSRNLLIFPNLIINDIMAATIRVFQPTGPAGMDVTAWELAADAASLRLQHEVEQLLFLEARLLDDWDLDAWLTLYTPDARYVVPTTDLPEGDPRSELVFIDDDHDRMAARVARLQGRYLRPNSRGWLPRRHRALRPGLSLLDDAGLAAARAPHPGWPEIAGRTDFCR